jgi:hypothetical protein
MVVVPCDLFIDYLLFFRFSMVKWLRLLWVHEQSGRGSGEIKQGLRQIMRSNRPLIRKKDANGLVARAWWDGKLCNSVLNKNSERRLTSVYYFKISLEYKKSNGLKTVRRKFLRLYLCQVRFQVTGNLYLHQDVVEQLIIRSKLFLNATSVLYLLLRSKSNGLKRWDVGSLFFVYFAYSVLIWSCRARYIFIRSPVQDYRRGRGGGQPGPACRPKTSDVTSREITKVIRTADRRAQLPITKSVSKPFQVHESWLVVQKKKKV